MANNNNPEEKPKVSKLPLPISDSPLVIDLPDGQKIVIGKMTQGSVIEVATWRGVGRPDSRTSRLMLGVGNGNVNDEQNANTGQSSVPTKAKKPNDWRIILYYLNLGFSAIQKLPIKLIALRAKSIFSLPKRNSKPDGVKAKEISEMNPSRTTSIGIESATSASVVDEDIEAWLNRITEKASQKSTGATSEAKKPVKKSAPVKKTVKRTATSKTKRT